jgi:polar amino acid transport system substrate-binding protein
MPRPINTSRRSRRYLSGTALATGLAVAVLAGCGGSDGESAHVAASSKSFDLLVPGVLTAATQTEQPPFAFAGADGKPSGFAIDLANEAANRLGLKVEYKFTNLQGILTGLTAGKYDIGVAGVGATAERKQSVSFVKPYFWSYLGILTKPESTATSLSDFTGRRIGVVSGSVQEAFATTKLTGSTVIRFKDQPSAVGQLLTGGVDGFLVGGPDAEEYVKKEKGKLKVAVEAESLQGTSLPVRKDNTALVTALDSTIDEMITDGTYLRLYTKYFSRPVAPQMIAERPALAKVVDQSSPAATP